MKPDHAAELSAVRRFALSACCTTRLIPAATASTIGSASFSMAGSSPCSARRCASRRKWDQRRDLVVVRVVARRKPLGNADAVGLGTVLAHLALAFEPHDGNAHADDPAQLR